MTTEKDKQQMASQPAESEKKLNFFGQWVQIFVVRYRIVYILMMVLAILGVSSYLGLPREINPEIVLPYGYVFTLYPGASPEDVERLVTEKIENRISDISDIKTLSSTSGSGFSQIFVEYEQGVDVKEKNSEVSERINGIISELPKEAETPVVENFETNNAPIMIINISGDYDFVTLKNMGESISESLETLPDVKEAKVVGGLEREISIVVEPTLMERYGLTIEMLQGVVAAANIDIPSGRAVLDDRTFNIRTINSFEAITDIGDILVAYREGKPLYLKDVAKVKDGYKKAETFSRMSENLQTENAGMKASISISVKKKSKSDVINTSKLVTEKLEKEKGKLYPENLSVQISGDMAKLIDDQLGSVTGNALSGLVLVLVVLYLFIGLSESLIVSTVIPLSILATLWLMKLFGLTINSITLFSMVLAVGMLVDNGIVIMENIDRLRHMGYDSKRAAIEGTEQVAMAVFSSMLTTIAAFFPIMLTTGIMGAFIKPIPMTVIFALVSSFVIAMTVTPALCAKLLKDKTKYERPISPLKKRVNQVASVLLVFTLGLFAFMQDGKVGGLSIGFGIFFAIIMIAKHVGQKHRLEDSALIQGFGKVLEKIVSKRRNRVISIVALLVALVMSMSLLATGLLKVEMFGSEDQDRLYVSVTTPKGTPIEKTDAILSEVEKILLKVPEIETFVTNVGSVGADSFEDFGNANTSNPTYGRMTIDLYPKEKRERTSIQLGKDLRESVKNIPGATIKIEELQSGPPSGSPVLIRVRGENLDDMKQVTRDFEAILKEIPGTRDLRSSVSQGEAELKIHLERDKLKRYGISEAQVGMAVRNAVEGIKATAYRLGQDDIDVMIRSGNVDIQSVNDIYNIVMMNPMGTVVKVGDVAKITMEEGLTGISREALKRQMYVQSDLMEGYNAVEVTEQFKASVKDYVLPEGIVLNYGGVAEDVGESFTEMFLNMIIAAILVFMILAIQFNSLSQPIIILFTVPMALIGVLPGLFLTGNSFGFTAFIGVVALVGIGVNDAIVLVDYANSLRKEGKPIIETIVETGRSRFIPVMATTITTAGGILPLSIQEKFFQPMGVALICGLCTATVLTLVIIPVLYTSLELHKEKRRTKKQLKEMKINGGIAHEGN